MSVQTWRRSVKSARTILKEKFTQQDVNSSYGGEKDAVFVSSHSTTLNMPRRKNSLNNI